MPSCCAQIHEKKIIIGLVNVLFTSEDFFCLFQQYQFYKYCCDIIKRIQLLLLRRKNLYRTFPLHFSEFSFLQLSDAIWATVLFRYCVKFRKLKKGNNRKRAAATKPNTNASNISESSLTDLAHCRRTASYAHYAPVPAVVVHSGQTSSLHLHFNGCNQSFNALLRTCGEYLKRPRRNRCLTHLT